MTIQRIPGEDRFWVQSRTRDDIVHTVDLQGEDPPRTKLHPTCTCEAFIANPQTKGKPCPHIVAVVQKEIWRLHHETTKATT